MKIQINTDKNINGDERHQEHFTSLIKEALKRFESHITRIEVFLKDENGEKDGLKDMSCAIEARIEGKQPIAVSTKSDTIERALEGAIEKLKTSLETTIGRMKNH